MPEKKKQHYVSQFLLRNFSCEASEDLINFYDRKSDRTHRQAVIKTQAQEKYFYGEDLTFENFLGITEKKAAPVIREIFETGKLPPKEDIRYKRLLHFIMLYSFRTKAATEHTEDYLNAMMREYAKYSDELGQIDWNEYRLSHPEPGAMNLAYYMDNWVVGADLEPLLLVNLTNKDFFISDDPLIQYNPFMQSRKCYWNANSLMNKGLILLFPLHPKWYIMLYDPCVYDVLVSRDLVVVDKSSDVYKINLLQTVYADRFVYFSDSLNERYVRNMAQDGGKRKLNKYIHKEVRHPETGRPALFSYYLPHKIDFYFSFMRDGKEAKDYDVHSKLEQVRSQEIIDWVEKDRPSLRLRDDNSENYSHIS
jgi:hypothetical protein